MKHRKKMRRGAILALVLVLLLNTMGVQAGTGAPSITVNSYVGLYTTLENARDGDVIGIKGTIVVPSPDKLDYACVTLKRMEAGAKIIFRDDYGYGGTSQVNKIYFDGNSSDIGGDDPFIVVSGNVDFNMCDFVNCYYSGGNGGALYISSGEVNLSSCSFLDNCADYGGAVFNRGTLTIDNCTIKSNWAEEMGGSIYNAGTLTIRNTEIKDSTARIGGGIYNNSSAELYNSLVWSNTASIHGSDLANEGSLSNYTTDEEYNSWLSHYQLYYAGWQDELNTSIGGAGEYKKFLTTDTAPTPSEGDNTGDEGLEEPPEGGSNQEENPPSEEESSGEDPSTPPSNEEVGGENQNITNNVDSSGSNNSSATDNSVSNGDTVTNSSQNTNNSSSVVSGDTVTNSSQSSDNHSSYNEDHSYKDTSTSTVNNYYQQEAPVASQNGSQPVNVSVPVNITVPKQNEADTGTTGAPEQVITVPQDIKIEAEGVDLVYEYTENGVSISIKASKEPESEDPAVTTLSTPVMAPEQAESPQNSTNWVEIVTMLLLAVLVLAELRDKIKAH
ncbi:MAG: hypothetical protein ACI4AQ_05830 [Lachnospiraceae bacterium]